MKQIFLILSLIVGTTTFAQDKTAMKSQTTLTEKSVDSNGDKIKKLTEDLDLSSDQQSKLKSILEKHDEIEANSKGHSDEMKRQNKELENEFRAILNPDQIKKFDEMQKEREARRDNAPHQLKKAKVLKRQNVEIKEEQDVDSKDADSEEK